MIPKVCGWFVATSASFAITLCVTKHMLVLTLGGAASMKLVTAINMVLAGLMLVLMADHEKQWKKTVIFGLGFLQFWLYGQYIQVGLMLQQPLSSLLGTPSLGSVVAFALSGVAGMSCAFNGKFALQRLWLGISITSIAGLGMLGYLANQPLLYWQIPGVSIGIAIPALILFLVLGVGLMTLGEK